MNHHPKSCLHPDFKYVLAKDTDLKKTFARIKREQKAAAEVKQTPQKIRRVV